MSKAMQVRHASGAAGAAAATLDWPLSRNEKKNQLMHLCDKEVQAADRLLVSERAALAAVREELSALKRSQAASRENDEDAMSVQAAEDVWQVVERAAAVLRAVLPAKEETTDAAYVDAEGPWGMGKSRSESSLPFKPALSRTPGGSRCGTPKRRVSFSDCLPRCVDAEPDKETISLKASMGSDWSEPEPEECASVEACHDEPISVSGTLHIGLNELCAPAGLVEKVGLGIKDLPPETLVVRRVTPASWAAAKGIQVGDVLVAVGGRRAEDLTGPQFVRLMQSRPLHLVVERLPADLLSDLTPRASHY